MVFSEMRSVFPDCYVITPFIHSFPPSFFSPLSVGVSILPVCGFLLYFVIIFFKSISCLGRTEGRLQQCFSDFNAHMNHLGALWNADFDSAGLAWGPRSCISHRLPGGTNVAGLWPTGESQRAAGVPKVDESCSKCKTEDGIREVTFGH